MTNVTLVLRRLLVHWRSFVIILVPLVLSPLIIYVGTKEAKCGFVVVLMSIYWMTEAVPLAVTSFIPVILFPLLDVLDTERVCNAYLKETNMMFIGGLIVAIAVEHCNLHKRIALKVILTIGTSPVRLLLGFMITTMVLSMWISNTATTAMMTPIVKAVLDELKAHKDVQCRRRTSSLNTADSEQASGAFDPETRRKSVYQSDYEQDERPEKQDICYYLGVAYASNLGGAGTLTGTGTNLTFKGIWDTTFPNAGGVNFASWMIFGSPLMLINMFAAWIWLQFLFMGLFRKKNTDEKKQSSKEHSKIVRDVIDIKYKELGPMTFHEGSVLVLFMIVVILWFFRAPEFIPGWAELIADVEIDDATPVMMIVFFLFVFPANLDFLQDILRPNSNERRVAKASPALLTWKVVHEKVPWGLVCLLGGGFAMAAGSNESGLSSYLGEELVYLKVLPPFLILIVIATATTFLTEVSSNTAVANIILPVLGHMAVAMEIHPLYFMIPATLCCSYAFMLPVATPPNAIVLAASNMKTTDMMKAGIGMNIICLILLCSIYLTYGAYVYDLDNFNITLFNSTDT